MSRRRNRLETPDLLPDQKPIYAVDDFDTALHMFLRDGKIRNNSPYTLTFYRDKLQAFRRILEEQKLSTVPAEISDKVIKERVILYLFDNGTKETTINTILRAVRAFFNYL